jgi:hypothetical protein
MALQAKERPRPKTLEAAFRAKPQKSDKSGGMDLVSVISSRWKKLKKSWKSKS